MLYFTPPPHEAVELSFILYTCVCVQQFFSVMVPALSVVRLYSANDKALRKQAGGILIFDGCATAQRQAQAGSQQRARQR